MRAAVMWAPRTPLTIEEVTTSALRPDEVRIATRARYRDTFDEGDVLADLLEERRLHSELKLGCVAGACIDHATAGGQPI